MSRSKTIDILRAIAVIAVLGRHMHVCPPEVSAALYHLTTGWQQAGWAGVDLFFVLSGFLISGLLFREHKRYGSISFRHFFVRRGLKIYPPFLVMILLTVVMLTLIDGGFVRIYLARELLFLQNYGGGLWNHTWSLAVEEHFYLLLPLLLIISLRIRRPGGDDFAWIPMCFLVIAALCLGLRVYTAVRYPNFDHMTHIFPTHLRIDSLFAGVLVGYLYHYKSERFWQAVHQYRNLYCLVALALFTLPVLFVLEETPWMYTIGLSLLWVAGSLLLLAYVHSDPGDSWFVRVLAFIGSRSYSIYLWHMVMATWGIDLARTLAGPAWNWYAYALCYLVGSVLLGTGMAYLVETPVLRLRDLWFPSRSQTPAQEAQPPEGQIKASGLPVL
ncbi:MAG: hypothetical protein OHK0022_39140 [Roseiflexaceae bacterium]